MENNVFKEHSRQRYYHPYLFKYVLTQPTRLKRNWTLAKIFPKDFIQITRDEMSAISSLFCSARLHHVASTHNVSKIFQI